MKQRLWLLIFLLTVVGTFSDAVTVFADPPSWAPAHGYRRKHGDDHKHKKYKHKDHREYDERLETRVRETVLNSSQLEIFRTCDLNRDGRISLREWQESEDLFYRLDSNRDSLLTQAEYAAIDSQRGLLSTVLYGLKQKVSSFWSWLF